MNKLTLFILMLVMALAGCVPPNGITREIASTGGRSDNPYSEHQPTVAPGVHFAGGDGSSLEKAVVVLGATEPTGVDAEYAWLHEHFPGYGQVRQGLIQGDKGVYDRLDFTTPDGVSHTVYFDIGDYFGKM